MKAPTILAVLPVVLAFITIPATSQAQNPSHLHLGHVADGWRGAPDGMGLLPAASAEGEIAARHAELAVSGGEDIGSIKTHVGHVMHALDPESAESGPGLGFGMIDAARGAVTHMTLAAESESASDNLKSHSQHVIASSNNVVEWGLVVMDLARRVQETDDAGQAAELAAEISATMTKITVGHDENGDGRVGWQSGEGGLEQAEFHLNLLKRGEG